MKKVSVEVPSVSRVSGRFVKPSKTKGTLLTELTNIGNVASHQHPDIVFSGLFWCPGVIFPLVFVL